MERFIAILEGMQEKYASREMVLELTAEDISDYERGKIFGEIQMLTHIMMEVALHEKG